MKNIFIIVLLYTNVLLANEIDDIDVDIVDNVVYIKIDGKQRAYPIGKEDLAAPEQLIEDILEDLVE